MFAVEVAQLRLCTQLLILGHGRLWSRDHARGFEDGRLQGRAGGILSLLVHGGVWAVDVYCGLYSGDGTEPQAQRIAGRPLLPRVELCTARSRTGPTKAAALYALGIAGTGRRDATEPVVFGASIAL